MTQAWLDAGYKTAQVDMESRKLVLVRLDGAPPPIAPKTSIKPANSVLSRVRQRLGGTVTIPSGVDLTAPTGEVWDAEQ